MSKLGREIIEGLCEVLEATIPPFPPVDAICHFGIVSQLQCRNCSRLSAAHDALTEAKAYLASTGEKEE